MHLSILGRKLFRGYETPVNDCAAKERVDVLEHVWKALRSEILKHAPTGRRLDTVSPYQNIARRARAISEDKLNGVKYIGVGVGLKALVEMCGLLRQSVHEYIEEMRTMVEVARTWKIMSRPSSQDIRVTHKAIGGDGFDDLRLSCQTFGSQTRTEGLFAQS